jgi:hypothetical protein
MNRVKDFVSRGELFMDVNGISEMHGIEWFVEICKTTIGLSSYRPNGARSD